MIRSIRNRALAAALLAAGIGQAWAEPPSPYGANRPGVQAPPKPVTTPILPDDAPHVGPPPVVLPPVVMPSAEMPAKPPAIVKADIKIIMVKEPGRPDRRCLLTDQKKLPNGSTVYTVKALDNGEVMSITHDSKGETERTDDVKSASALPGDLKILPSPSPTMPMAQPATASKPESEKRPSFLKRFFAKSPLPDPTPKAPVAAMPPTNQVILPALQVAPAPPPMVTNAQALDIKTPEPNNPGVAKVDLRTSLNPVSASKAEPPLFIDPSTVSRASVEPMPRSLDPQTAKVNGLQESLKNAERPSLRMIAAEDLLHNVPGHMESIRGALMAAAQDDEAACVRATCIRCLSKLGARDENFRSLLETAQDHEDEDVREEAEYALKKLAKK